MKTFCILCFCAILSDFASANSNRNIIEWSNSFEFGRETASDNVLNPEVDRDLFEADLFILSMSMSFDHHPTTAPTADNAEIKQAVTGSSPILYGPSSSPKRSAVVAVLSTAGGSILAVITFRVLRNKRSTSSVWDSNEETESNAISDDAMV